MSIIFWFVAFLASCALCAMAIKMFDYYFRRSNILGRIIIMLGCLLAVSMIIASLYNSIVSCGFEADLSKIGDAYVITTDNDNDAPNYIRESGKDFSEIELLEDGYHIAFYQGGVVVDEVVLPKNNVKIFVLGVGNELSQELIVTDQEFIWFSYRSNTVLSHFTKAVSLWLMPAEAAYLSSGS